MGVSRKWGPYGVKIGATLLGAITRQNLVTGSQVMAEATSGEIWQRFVALYAQKVAPGFSTLDIANAINAAGVMGVSIAGLTGGLSLYAQKYAAGGGRMTGANHIKYGFTAGILYPKSLTVPHRGDATLEYDALITYDGTNNPVVVTESVTLPTGLTDANRYTLGPMTVAGLAISEVQSFQIDFGLDVVGDSADGDIWDTMASIREQKTVLSWSGIDLDWFASSTMIPLAGVLGTEGNTTIYLTQRALGGAFTPAATAQHIAITANGMLYVDQPMDADGKKAADAKLKMVLNYDGTNAPLAITTASAITGNDPNG